MNQINRSRPSFQTAHDYRKVGVWEIGPEHWLSDDERERIGEEVAKSLDKLMKAEFPRTGNLEYAILKAHLIVEHAITEHIRVRSAVLVDHGYLRRFSFSQKLEIAYLLGFGVNDPVMLPTVERLNQIRNQVAHSFLLDRALVDEMLRVNSEDYDEFEIRTDRDRIRHLRWLCMLICGYVAGRLDALIFWERLQREALAQNSARPVTSE